jgi:hypothetical protein
LLGEILQGAGHDSCHWFVTITDQHLFATPHDPYVGAKPGFQIADVYGPHAAIIANMTMLVIF